VYEKWLSNSDLSRVESKLTKKLERGHFSLEVSKYYPFNGL
jgi:hypothetical protein